MASFQTNQLKGRRKVEIDGHGYTVRRMGNIEQLEYSRSIRKLQKLAVKESNTPLTDEESNEVDAISAELAEMFISLFDDGGDQSKSRKLVSSLSEDEIGELIKLIFEDKKVVDETKV